MKEKIFWFIIFIVFTVTAAIFTAFGFEYRMWLTGSIIMAFYILHLERYHDGGHELKRRK